MNYADIKQAMPHVDSWCYSNYGFHYTEDARSEILLIALEKNYEERGVKLTSWLIEVAKNVCMKVASYNSYRRKKEGDVIQERVCYQECNIDVEKINQVVDCLPDPLKVPLQLRMQGYTVKEIAAIQKLKPTSVKSRIWEARNKLKHKLLKVQAEN